MNDHISALEHTGYCTDHNGKPSMMRIMSAWSLAFSFILALLCVYLEIELGAKLSFGFLVGAFAPKVLQKVAEGWTIVAEANRSQ